MDHATRQPGMQDRVRVEDFFRPAFWVPYLPLVLETDGLDSMFSQIRILYLLLSFQRLFP